MADEVRARHEEIVLEMGNGGSLSHSHVLDAMAKAAAEARAQSPIGLDDTRLETRCNAIFDKWLKAEYGT